MKWILLSLTTAFLVSINDVVRKKMVVTADPFCVAFWGSFSHFVFLLPLACYLGIPELNHMFFIALFGSALILWFVSIIYLFALQCGEISNTVPMLCFTPAFLLITSNFMLNEFPGRYGLAGVLLIVVGAYILNLRNFKDSFFAPIRSVFEKRGPAIMLLVAFLWSITANIDKIGVINSSAVFWSTSVFGSLTFLNFLTIAYKKKIGKSFRFFKANPIPVVAMGVIGMVAIVCQMQAIKMAMVPYVISLKRTSALFCVLWGKLFFKEENLGKRFLGALIMFSGILFIILGSGK